MSEEEQEVLKTFKSGLGLTSAEREILANYIDKLQKENEFRKTAIEVDTILRNYNIEEIEKLQKENKELNKTIEQLENTIVELSTAMEE